MSPSKARISTPKEVHAARQRQWAGRPPATTGSVRRTLPTSHRCLHSTLNVGRWAFGVFSCPLGRVAESGLRHSTRNRAWGNPPWVRIPPLPPVYFAVHGFLDKNKVQRRLSQDLNCIPFIHYQPHWLNPKTLRLHPNCCF